MSLTNIETKTSSIWDERYEEGKLACTQNTVNSDPIDYTQHPFLYKHSTAKQLTGDPEGNPLQLVAEKYLKPPAKKMLAVGSGLAFAEEWLAKNGYVEHIVAFEASSVAVDSARERVKSLGLQDRMEIRCGDVLSAGFEDGEFDAVFVQAAIHHFYNIDEMFEFFHRVLKANGLIIYDEYVGPDHHMYEPEVMGMMDEINECLATPYRWDVMRKATRDEVPQATLQWMLEMDPSEGVHSSKILPLTYKYFNVEFRRDYGGTFMRPFFVGILPNFDWDNSKDQTVARLIILMENMLIKHGIIPSYHTRIVGRKKDEPSGCLNDDESLRINYSNWKGFEKYGEQSKLPRVSEFCASNYSDENWKNGVGVFSNAVLFLPASKKAKADLVVGKKVSFGMNDDRIILDVSENNGSLILTFTGERLNPKVAGYPNVFRIFSDVP
jgi:ubiquinone/menaquinone biosynthesis C-methylase UbiE